MAVHCQREARDKHTDGLDCRDEIDVIMVPSYKGNPYVQLLCNGLKSSGIRALETRKYFPVVRTWWNAGRPSVLHMHWIHQYCRGNNPPISIIKSSKFIIELSSLRLIGVRLVWTVHNLINHEDHWRRVKHLTNHLLSRIFHRIIVHSSSSVEVVSKSFNVYEEKYGLYLTGRFPPRIPIRSPGSKREGRLDVREGNVVFLYFGTIRGTSRSITC